mgnify:CR=1 FL=1
MANEKKVAREPSFLLALVPIVAMIGFMLYCFLGHSESGYHDAHLPLVMSIVVACIVGHFCGHDFKDMLAGMIERLSASMEAVLILCTVGFLVSSFMASGAIPSLIVYGLDLLTPKLFLPVGCILCAIVGMACGSSWTTTATIGLAFLGIGAGLGIGYATAKSSEAIARQPEAEGKIRTTMMLGLVFLETAIIYALLVVILIIFVL